MKKFTVCLLIGAMAASMLTGCGGSNSKSENTQEAKADDDLTKLTIMLNGSDSDAYMQGYRKVIENFNKTNDMGVIVESQNISNADYKTKLTTMMASDSEPDIIFTWELGYLENFVNGNKIVITESIVSYSLGINAINFTYEYVNGKFVPTSRYGSYKEIYSADGSSRHFTVSSDLPAYTRPGATAVNTTLKTGSLTKIIKCALINGKIYIQLECDGEIYWIKALENPPIADNERQFMEVRYAG